MIRSRENLLALAGRYAAERRAPVATIIKELLHYEILYALLESGAAENLVFQGGTCLRLCHRGTRYSEDLDFVADRPLPGRELDRFEKILRTQIAGAYGLAVSARQRIEPREGSLVQVARINLKIEIPNADRSAQQKQLINVEIAGVPAHDYELLPVSANYPHLPSPFRSMLVRAETRREIMADKVIALGARSYLKYRDVWDLKFLEDGGQEVDLDLIQRKVGDYKIAPENFVQRLKERQAFLGSGEAHRAFQQEMSRFLDAGISAQLDKDRRLVQKIMDAAVRCAAKGQEFYQGK